jgi:hypothetical protein
LGRLVQAVLSGVLIGLVIVDCWAVGAAAWNWLQ